LFDRVPHTATTAEIPGQAFTVSVPSIIIPSAQ